MKAHGVTLRGSVAYLLVWALIALASRFSISALGLQFAPQGSSSLDTVAILLMLLPATIIVRCLCSQAPTLEVTRSRGRQPAQLLWATTLGLAAFGSPMLAAPLLHRSIDKVAFLAGWSLILGLCLVLGAVLATPFAALGSFSTLAIFSTPGLLPWRANVLYNVDIKNTSVVIGATLLIIGILLSSLRNHITWSRGLNGVRTG
jgi:hypothetical protein